MIGVDVKMKQIEGEKKRDAEKKSTGNVLSLFIAGRMS
jgi:hypothetical protein